MSYIDVIYLFIDVFTLFPFRVVHVISLTLNCMYMHSIRSGKQYTVFTTAFIRSLLNFA